MCDLLPRVDSYVRQRGLFTAGETVVVGVSGGPDSICLLHLLARLADGLGLRLHAAHLNHRLRGAEADADAAFVAELAEAWGVPCTVGRAEVAALAERAGLSLEEAARQARYAFLADVARAAAARVIAVGHNADDQAETVLMHFLRGSGAAGLRGMLPATDLAEYRLAMGRGAHPERRLAGGGPESKDDRRPSTGEVSFADASRPPAQDASELAAAGETEQADDRRPSTGEVLFADASRPPAQDASELAAAGEMLRLVRPLLEIPRADILAYCADRGLAYRFDRSNEDTTFYRNRLRHELLPLLETYNPAIRAVLGRTAETLAGDYEVLAAALERAWTAVARPAAADEVQFDRTGWRGLPIGLQRALVREAIRRLRRHLRNINWEQVERAVRMGQEGQPGQAATLAAGLELQVGADRLRIAAEGTLPPAGADLPQIARRYELAAPGVTALERGWQATVVRLERAALPDDYALNADPWRAWLDADAVGPDLALRPRVPGDRLQPQGLGGHSVRLNELMINLKTPRAARAGWPILEGRFGVAWACGLRLDERAGVSPRTRAVWQITFERAGQTGGQE
ncbi:MAG: tRNA(Ile)-lysidine synthase [Chloroflexi bacterium ADurb.Bin325]|nr:MAG: tRNA(Ile)-lysidine synthase [Chloroflexi bacterium ADurb.Bin325]